MYIHLIFQILFLGVAVLRIQEPGKRKNGKGYKLREVNWQEVNLRDDIPGDVIPQVFHHLLQPIFIEPMFLCAYVFCCLTEIFVISWDGIQLPGKRKNGK